MKPQDFEAYYDELDQPWDEFDATKYYVENPRKKSLEEVAKRSGVPFKTISDWSRGLNSKKIRWVDERKAFQAEYDKKTKLKTIEKISEVTSSKLAEILIDHYNSFERTKTIIDFKFEIELRAIEKIKARYQAGEIDEAEASKELANFTASNLNFNSLSQERVIRGQREALGISVWQDLNVAQRVLEDRGYKIVDAETYEKLISDETEESPEG